MNETLTTLVRRRLESEKERVAPPDEAIAIPPIAHGRYTDTEMFELELGTLFAKTWLFVGHESEWPEPGSYSQFNRVGAPLVIVRGEDGDLRAFFNACRHRGAPVTREQCGSARRLTCQYHSWSYGTDGQLKSVPDSRSFVDLDKGQLGLVQVRCEIWEGWVFVNQCPDGETLVEFLGPLAEEMLPIDGPNARLVGTQTHNLGCNWKLMVDAFLEVYHIRTIHPDNAALLYDDQATTVAMLPNGHSRLTVDKREELRDLSFVSPEFDNPSVPLLWRQTSTSFGIFPNIVLPMDTGAFVFLCMWPVAVDRTELELRWYAPEWSGNEVPADHLAKMDLFETVMAQDTANMAPIQASVSSAGARPFQIGWHERLIHHFHRAVDLAIGQEAQGPLAVSTALDRFVEDQ